MYGSRFIGETDPIEIDASERIALGDMLKVKTEGYDTPRHYSYSGMLHRLPPLTYDLIREMLKNHAISAAADLRRSVVLSPIVKVSGPDNVQRLVLKTVARLWQKAVPKLLDGMFYTRSAVELKYANIRGQGLQVIGAKSFDPRDVTPLGDAKTGRWVGFRVRNIKHRTSGRGATEDADEPRGYRDLQFPKGIFYIHRREHDGWHGRSELEAAFPPFWELMCSGGALENRRLWYFKSASQGGTMYHPEGGQKDEWGNFVKNSDYARQIVEYQSTGHTLTMPNTRDESGNREWEYVDPKVHEGGETFNDYVDHLERRCKLGVGVPPELLESPESGAYAGRSVTMQAFLDAQKTIVSDLIHTLDEQCIRYLVNYNLGSDASRSYNFTDVDIDTDRLMPERPKGVEGATPETTQMSAEPRPVESEARIVVAFEGDGL